ncbi:DUF2071 domain-containing protein [Paenibacillus chondroitinus]|uniref:DUF2071 domain-containing protein n=1 Tax=Paenibacillus chondroitinus TaxID=59842 RepID=A0ABU6DNF2_9BACL|nr:MULTISPECIES: DUF2071 domain-containing protein [Paenibacillus]MCY9660577.1 DUF2071 domain-containing protein [Paenibacillus anseongense]MEB4799309.1 DUF2071 domain-containing protein [Paenibacillus chondroitinus]
MSRSWPLPAKPWIMHQIWNDLLFAHWPVPVEIIRNLLPSSIPIDTFEGTAWVGVVPFHMTGVTPRGIPALPYFSSFPEINVRTYVTIHGKPGVYFFSLDAHNKFAVEAARILFHLPYFYTQIEVKQTSNNTTFYHSVRQDPRARQGEFLAEYRPTSPIRQAIVGTLEYWLTERYCLYCKDRSGRIYRGEIDHDPWPLQSAEAEISMNTLPASFGIKLPEEAPVLHFAKQLKVKIWALEKLNDHFSNE